MKYYYTREFINDNWNISHAERMDSKGDRVILATEIQNAFADKSFLFFGGYDGDPSVVCVDFKDITLSEEENSILDTVVYNHKNNVADKYAIKHNGSLVMNPEIPTDAILFNTEESAQQGIIALDLPAEECQVVPIVVL